MSSPKEPKVFRYKNVEVPRQNGEVGRLRVLKGADQGLIFVLKESSVTFGRGEDADVMISDLKASRAHARLDYTHDGWVMNDLGSANGIFFQGEYIRKFAISSGEHFTIGDTIFEFLTSTESTRVLTAPLRPGQEVANQDQALINQRIKVKGLSQSAQIAPPAGGAPKKNNARTLLLVVILAGAYFYLNQPAPQAPVTQAQKSKAKKETDRSLASYLPPGVTKEVAKTAEEYYRQGFREYREGNYLRAKARFELTLQVNPNHELARHYLASSEKAIDDEIKSMIAAARKESVAGRLREAKGYYETAMRLMYYDRSNPDFVECEDALKKINEELDRTL